EASFSFSNPAPASPGTSADGPESQVPGPTTAPQVLQEAAPALDGTRPSSTPDPPKTQSPSASALPEVVTPQNDAERGASSETVIRPVAATSGAEDDPLAPAPEPRDNFQGPASASIAAAEASGDLVLRVAATQSSWVAVDADGKVVLESVLNQDQVRTLVAKNFFDVTTANARGTTLTLNGVTLQPLGRQGELKKVHLTHANLKQLTP
ncbi:MAG: RodZ domain-containing protein, partial [Terriglobia bacterium]